MRIYRFSDDYITCDHRAMEQHPTPDGVDSSPAWGQNGDGALVAAYMITSNEFDCVTAIKMYRAVAKDIIATMRYPFITSDDIREYLRKNALLPYS